MTTAITTSPLLISCAQRQSLVAVAPQPGSERDDSLLRQSPPPPVPAAIGAVVQLPFLPAGPPQLGRSVSAASARGMNPPGPGAMSPRVGGPPGSAQLDWRAHVSIEERFASRNKIREAYLRTCKTYEELLDVAVAIEEELLHMSCTGRLEYLKAGLEWDNRLQQKRKQLAGQLPFVKHVRTSAVPVASSVNGSGPAPVVNLQAPLAVSAIDGAAPAAAPQPQPQVQAAHVQHTLKSLTDSDMRNQSKGGSSLLKRKADDMDGSSTSSSTGSNSGTGRSVEQQESAAATAAQLPQTANASPAKATAAAPVNHKRGKGNGNADRSDEKHDTGSARS